jgi:hypothetical protein
MTTTKTFTVEELQTAVGIQELVKAAFNIPTAEQTFFGNDQSAQFALIKNTPAVVERIHSALREMDRLIPSIGAADT